MHLKQYESVLFFHFNNFFSFNIGSRIKDPNQDTVCVVSALLSAVMVMVAAAG